MLRKLKTMLFACLLIGSTQAMAAFVPVGVQVNVNRATVSDTWGWSVCYDGRGYDYANLSSILNGCQGNNLMLAAYKDGQSSYAILAAAGRSDVLFDTGVQSGSNDISHAANGSQWYYSPSWSWGFSKLGNAVQLNSCDVNLYGNYGGSGNQTPGGNVGMCWHTGGGSLSTGWGLNTGNNFVSIDSTWHRVLLVANSNEVPEPSTLALLGIAVAGLAAARRRNKANA